MQKVCYLSATFRLLVGSEGSCEFSHQC